MTRSARSASGSSQDSHRACRPRCAQCCDEFRVVTVALRQRGAAGEHDPRMTDVGAGKFHDVGMIDTMHAIEVAETGGPEVLQYVEKPTPSPGSGEVVIKAEAIGINFIDTYFRSGLYKREVPFIVGIEVCGTVEAVGDDVAALGVGDRVVTAQADGSYAEYCTAPADFCAYVPDGVGPDVAAASLLKGMTAHYLLKSVYPVQQGDSVLLHAGAGGVGLILTQWATSLAVRVITTVSTPEKAELCRQAGAVEVLDYPEDPAGVRRQDQGPDRRRGRCGVRRRRRRHLRGQPGQPGGARHACPVRRVQRTCPAVRPTAAQRRGLSVSDAAQPVALHPQRR